MKSIFELDRVTVCIISVGLMICSLSGCSRDLSPPTPPISLPSITSPQPAFPLVTSANQRYLQDQNGVPFPILGRTAWFIPSLSESDYKLFIDDTLAKGYNAIEFSAITHDRRGNHPPFSGNDALPFTMRIDGYRWTGSLTYRSDAEAPDFTQWNEEYWKHVDGLLTYAESKGVLCFMFPAYAGYHGGDEGWMVEMVANGVSKMKVYGARIADRYKARRNIVWMLGGDYGTGRFQFTSEQLQAENAMLAGVKSSGGEASRHISAEWDSESIYTDQTDPKLRAAGTLQGAYSFSGQVSLYTRNGYGPFDSDGTTPHSVMPTFLLEEPYDQEGPEERSINGAATQPVRRYQWWGWLSGIGGYIAGNGCVWPFNPPRLLSFSFCSDGWQAHLNTQGAQDMARLNAFVRSIAWYNLVPSGLGGMKTLVVAGGSQPVLPDYVAAAASPDGALLVAYIPPDHKGPLMLDMTVMSSQTQAHWFNPATAAYTEIGTFSNAGTQTFDPPANNGTSFTDWVLLLQRQESP
jgi:Protein of unknown function (DUF4038)/Putative collagen-binding domain of a collagenase